MADNKTFAFEDANGKKWEVQAPDLDSAVAAFKQQAGGAAVKENSFANRKAGFIPFLATDDKGDLKFDITAGLPANIVKSAVSGFTAPGDIMSGKLKDTDPDYMQRVMDTGMLMTGANPAVISGERAIPGALKNLVPEKPAIPTAAELKAAGGAGFEKAEGMGVDYGTPSVKSMIDEVIATKKLREKRAPDTFSVFNEVKSGPDASVVSLTGLRDIRTALLDIAGDFGPTAKKSDRKAAQDAIRALDQFMEEPPLKSALAGTGVSNGGTALAAAGPDAFAEAVQRLKSTNDRAKEAGGIVKEANANYAAAERSITVTNKLEKADISAAATNSGKNLDNRTRQVLSQIIDPERPRNRRGYSKEELALIDDIVHGKHGADLARYWGNFFGGGGGMHAFGAAGFGSAVGGGAGAFLGGPLGAAIGSPLGAAVPLAAGRLLKNLSSKITTSQAKKLDELIRKRSPLYQKATENPNMVPADVQMRMLLGRGLMQGAPGAFEVFNQGQQ